MSGAPARLLTLKTLGGSGPPILLLHGFGSDRLSWLANQGALEAAGTVLALDLPGHGREALPEASLEEIAATLAATLDAAGLAGAALVGHSLGGALALLLAARRPDLVRALVLVAPAGLGEGVDADFLARLPELSEPDEAEALLHRLVSRPRLISKPMVAGLLKHLASGDRRETLRRAAALLLGDGAAIDAAADAVAASGLPRLVVWGTEDRINRPDEARLARFGAERLAVPGAGHLPHVESAALVNGAILDVLGRAAR